MKKQLAKFVSFLLIFSILLCNPFVVYASDHGGGGSSSSRNLIKAQESIENREKIEKFFKEYFADVNGFFVYAASQFGAVLSGDYSGAYQSYLTMDDIINSTGLYVDDNGNPTDFYISSDLMEQIKSLLDQYAKNNEPYEMWNTFPLDRIPLSSLSDNKKIYDSIKNMLQDSESGILAVSVGFYYNKKNTLYAADIGSNFKNISPVGGVNGLNKGVVFYNNETWGLEEFTVKSIDYSDNGSNQVVTSCDDFFNSGTDEGTIRAFETCGKNYQNTYFGGMLNNNYLNLVTLEERRIRVFKTYGDFQNFTLGKRKVYYTSNYYDYVPADITVSSDELQQGIDDINTALDKLLEQIDANTSESDIENILQQILDELKNNHSGGSGTGGGGTGGTGTGGSTVDMSTTNSWLEKIYNKVCDVFDKMGQKDGDNASVSENSVGMSDINNVLKLIWTNTNVIVEKLMPDSVSGNSIDMTYTNSVLDSIKAGMDEMTELLKKIKGWTIADTILDGVGAISDLLSLVGDFLNDAGAVVSTAADSLAETADMMTDKFPFSIPWDLAMLVGILQAEPRAPVFHLPLVIESYGIEESINIDMSQFDSLSVIMRSMLTILYAYGILNMTTKVLNIGGGNK